MFNENKPLGVHQMLHARFVLGNLTSAQLLDFALVLHELNAGPGFEDSEFKEASAQLLDIFSQLSHERREAKGVQNVQ
tara:strand:+ start:35 stop:268 length:234 start_codon:yes stop_codon:yes gene_type:complete